MPRQKPIVFEWQQSRSDASRRGWEKRWEKAYQFEVDPFSKVGSKGRYYLERKYGPVIDERYAYDDLSDIWDVEFDY